MIYKEDLLSGKVYWTIPSTDKEQDENIPVYGIGFIQAYEPENDKREARYLIRLHPDGPYTMIPAKYCHKINQNDPERPGSVAHTCNLHPLLLKNTTLEIPALILEYVHLAGVKALSGLTLYPGESVSITVELQVRDETGNPL